MLSAILSEPTNGVIPVIADDIFSEINKVFNTRSYESSRGFPIDLIEKSDHYLIRAAVPGISKDNIEIIAEGNILSLKVDVPEVENDKEEVKFLRRELSYNKQFRKLMLPENADSESVEANLKNGILEVKVKKKEESMPKRINIST